MTTEDRIGLTILIIIGHQGEEWELLENLKNNEQLELQYLVDGSLN